MGVHDDYGKGLLRAVAGGDYEQYGTSVDVDYGAGSPARIDGTVGGRIAVEIESRTSKQVRGAVLDLLCHRFEKKLLLLLPAHMQNVQTTAAQCRAVLDRYIGNGEFRVFVLAGHGNDPKPEQDLITVREALRELGWEK